MPCFSACGCVCEDQDPDFDRVIARETKFDVRLCNIIEGHVGWYFDSIEELRTTDITALGDAAVPGVYVLWRQDGYCEKHEFEHFSAQYLGKAGGKIAARILVHQAKKLVGGDFPVEITVWPADNRRAKYVEQLLLDLYALPLNMAENPGCRPLCAHVAPGAWN